MSKAIESFGKYILLEKLAAGGMAEVYLAKSTGASGVSKFLAVKRILPQFSDHPEFIDMFKEEAKIAVNLNHSNVVSIFDFGIERGQFFLVMEYVEGQNLRQILNHLKKESKNFSIDQISFIVKEIAAGLDHAHRCIDGTTGRPLNITHRDMSPQNVMISYEGEIKIVDFGIAKAETQIEHTRAGTIKGKFGYMSPEQSDGQNVDLRTDIFSLGIILWELLANDRLFTANSEAATLKKIRECQIPPLRKMNPSVPGELERIVMKALAKDKNLRYQTCAAFNRDLSRFLNTQYPEFSPHDFSLHIKQAFSQLYLETKKKLVEYSKVTAHGADDKTQVTQTLTNTDASGSRNDDSLSFDMNGRKVEFSSGNEQKVNLNDLKTKKNATRLVPTVGTGSFSINNQNSPQVTTSTSIRPGTVTGYRPMPSQNNSNLWINLLMLVAVGLGGFWGYQKYDAKTRGDIAGQFTGETSTTLPTAGQTDSASSVQKPPPVQMNAVMIESVPNGARIFIDGKDSGMITPARTNIEANREFTLGLRKEGYHFYERKETATRNGLTVSATMQAATDIGYLTIEIINGGSDPVILLNNQRLTEKPPIRMLAVPADKPLKIEAYNVFTKLRAVQTVQVGNNQRRQVNLILSRDAREK